MISTSVLRSLVVATTIAAISSTAVASAAGGTARVLPLGHPKATEGTLLDLLAGSPDYLVYADGGQLAGGSHLSEAPEINEPSEQLLARTKSGKTIDLGHAPQNLEREMSLVGAMLTGMAQGPNPEARESLRWWDIATRRSGTLAIPKGYTYQSAAPNGVVLSKGDQLFDESTSGGVKSLGVPMVGESVRSVTAATSGLIVRTDDSPASSGSTPLYYLTFSRPGHFTALDSGTTLALVCNALDSVAAGCVAEGADSDGEPTFDYLSLIPLDGSAPTLTTTGPTDENPALLGKTMIWDSADGLRSMTLGDPTVDTGPKGLVASQRFITVNGDDPYQALHFSLLPMVSAFGQAALEHAAGSQIALASSVRKTTTTVVAPASPTSVSDFDLTSGRVVYADDQRQPHDGSARFSTYSATLTHPDGRLSVGQPRLVHAGTDYLHVGASNSVTVYASASVNEFNRLRIVYDHHVHTVVHVPYDAYLEVSGTRVMYAQNYNDGLASVYNAATGKTNTVQTYSGCCTTDRGDAAESGPALSGDAVTFVKPNGSVWRQQLGSNQPVRISGPVPHAHGGEVFATGNYVAWSITAADTTDQPLNGYRNIRTMAKAVSVPHEIVGVADDGVITASRRLVFTQTVTAAFSLRRFSGPTVALLSQRTIVGLPQVAGSTLAWVDRHGRLQLRQIH